ncbi:MAG: helix-turn-helix domain-containing protein [Erysipelotrichaceae bacterium]|nr:helix-turn-helix domain-containing protein [Erysipelotrichaceae bacterium]
MLEYEIINNPRIRRINLFVNEVTYRAHHLHSETEIILLMDGKGEITISGKSLPVEKDDIILINGAQPHEIRANQEKLLCLILQVSRSFLNEYVNDLRNISFMDNVISHNDKSNEDLRAIMYELGKIYFANNENYQLKCISLLTGLISSLLDSCAYEKIPENVFERKLQKEERISRILSEIEDRHQEQIRLEDIAKKEGITVTHLSHLIKDSCGIGFQDYLSDIRFEHSLSLLANDKLSLSDIAQESGFSELKYMNAMYLKTFSLSAAKYRQEVPQISYTKKKDAFTLENILDPNDSLSIIRKYSI